MTSRIGRLVHCWLAALALTLALSAGLTAYAAPARAADDATVLSEQPVSGHPRMLDLQIRSSSIDSVLHIKWVRLILPPGWSKTATRTWPTLWLLHGGVDDNLSWTKNTDIEALSANRDAIIVMPDTSWCSAYSDWWNYGNGGAPQWETYLTVELRRILADGYRAGGASAVAGVSMGGLGAMKLAAAHRGMFAAAASFSGNVDPLHSYDGERSGPDLPGLGCGADWKRVWGDYTIPAQHDIWVRNDPYDQAANLSGVRLFVSAGTGTDTAETTVYPQGAALAARLKSLGIPVTWDPVAGGGHNWTNWNAELGKAFPMLMSAIGA